MFWAIDEIHLLLAVLVAFAVTIELAFRWGRMHSASTDDATRAHVNALEIAVLGLLALLLGFNFAMSVARFDARKTLFEEEVNAINTTYLRVQLLPAQPRQEASALLRAYVAARVDFMRASIDQDLIDKAIASAADVEQRLWSIAGDLVAHGSAPIPNGLFIQSVNELINVNHKRHAALDNHVPETVLWLLLTVAMTSLGFMSYNYGLAGRSRHGAMVIFAALIGAVLIVIIDLDRPRTGLIQVSEDGMVRLMEAMDRKKK